MKKSPKNKEIQTAKHPLSKHKEKQEISTLQKILSPKILTDLTKGDDDFPNIDGWLHLLREDRHTTGLVLQVQIKPLKYNSKGNTSTTCGTALLPYALNSNAPILLIGVDSEKEEASWVYLSPEASASFLEQYNKAPQDTFTIHFPPKQKIKKDDDGYYSQWKEICHHHSNKSNDLLMTNFLNSQRDIFRFSPEDIVEKLKTLKKFLFYRTADGKNPAIDFVLSLGKSFRNESFGFALNRDEDSVNRVKREYLGILKDITYYRTVEVFKEVVAFHNSKKTSETIKTEIIKLIEEITKYNYFILISVGFITQRQILDVVTSWSKEEIFKNSNVIETVLTSLLNAGFEGVSMKDEITMEFKRGALEPTQYLKDIRKDVIDFVIKIYKSTKDLKTRIKMLEILEHASYGPDYGSGDEKAKVMEMLNENIVYICDFYKKVVTSNNKEITGEAPEVYEIETQLARFIRTIKDSPDVILLNKFIKKDKEFYYFFKLLAGDAMDLMEDGDYNDLKKKRDNEVALQLKAISKDKLSVAVKKLEKVAGYADYIIDWKLMNFNTFLQRIAETQPLLVDKILKQVSPKNSPLTKFLGNFMIGFRRVNNTKLWDKYLSVLIQIKHMDILVDIIESLRFIERPLLSQQIRDKDIELLTSVVLMDKEFKYLKKKKVNIRLFFVTYYATLYLMERDVIFKTLFFHLLKNYPDYIVTQLRYLDIALQSKWIDLSSWSNDEKNILVEMLTKVTSLEHNAQGVLHHLGQTNFVYLVTVLNNRMRFKEENPEVVKGVYYDSIPQHMNQELITFIQSHAEYKNQIKIWISELNEEDALYKFNLRDLLNKVGGDAFSEVLDSIMSTGEEKDIDTVIEMFPSMEAPNFDTCLRIVDRTDDIKIWRRIMWRMESIGSFSGAYGEDIIGKAHQKILDQIKEENKKTKSKRIKKFTKLFIPILELQIKKDRKDHLKEIRKRKEEFKRNKE